MARKGTYQIVRLVTSLVAATGLYCSAAMAQEFDGYSQKISSPRSQKKDTITVDTAYLNAYYRLCKLYGITPLVYKNDKVDNLLKRYQGNYGTIQLLQPLPAPALTPKADTASTTPTELVNNEEIPTAPHRMVLDEGKSLNNEESKRATVVNQPAQEEVVDQLTDASMLVPIQSSGINNNSGTIAMDENPIPAIQLESQGQSTAVPIRKAPAPQPTINRATRDTMANPIDQNRRNLMKLGGGDTHMYVPEEEVGIRVEIPKTAEELARVSEQKARPYPSSFLSVSGKAEEQDVVGTPLNEPKAKPRKHQIYMPTPAPNTPVAIEKAQFDEDLNFVVQIAACKKPLTPTYLAQLYKSGRRLMVLQEGGWYKYFVVSSGSYEYAKKSLKAVPVDGAFIAAYTKDGTKQALWQAKQEAKQKQAVGEMDYVVQLAASRKPASNFELRRLYAKPEKIIVIKEGGWYKYQLSFGNSLEDALAFKKTLKYNEESFITGYDKFGVAHMIK